MTQETTCPACGAPLVITGGKDAVRCTFCGADLVMQEAGGRAAFRVAGQPDPQKETLSKPVEGQGDSSSGLDLGPQMEANSQEGNFPATFGVEEISGSGMEAISAGPSFETAVPGRGAPYQAGEERRGRSRTGRWITIAIAALFGLLVLCACLGISLLAIFRNNIH